MDNVLSMSLLLRLSCVAVYAGQKALGFIKNILMSSEDDRRSYEFEA